MEGKIAKTLLHAPHAPALLDVVQERDVVAGARLLNLEYPVIVRRNVEQRWPRILVPQGNVRLSGVCEVKYRCPTSVLVLRNGEGVPRGHKWRLLRCGKDARGEKQYRCDKYAHRRGLTRTRSATAGEGERQSEVE